ncbi:unnamed protein product [Discosporangium mesarthrocarpum]
MTCGENVFLTTPTLWNKTIAWHHPHRSISAHPQPHPHLTPNSDLNAIPSPNANTSLLPLTPFPSPTMKPPRCLTLYVIPRPLLTGPCTQATEHPCGPTHALVGVCID